MNSRQNPLFWSFGIGTWAGTKVRVSVFFPLLAAVLCWNLHSLALGIAVSVILFVSVLLHEFGHVFAARQTGGFGEEILIWPLGGLAFVETAKNFRSQFLTALAGPLVNFALCSLAFPFVISSPHAAAVWNPLYLPDVTFADRAHLFEDICVLIFALNWFCLLINLLPIFPLDGGRMLQAFLNVQFPQARSLEISINVGIIAAVLLGLVGVLCNLSWILGLSFLVILLALQESQRLQSGEAFDDSFMGYDFSQGYTSLEQSQVVRPEPRPTAFQRWREKRKAEKQKRQEVQEQQAEVELDLILAKIKEHGIQALTEAERRQLQRASARCRDKFKPPS